MKQKVTTLYLEMRSFDDLQPAAKKPDMELRRAEELIPEVDRFLWMTIGSPVSWRNRRAWSKRQWLEHINRPEQQTLIAYIRNTPAGYVDLVQVDDEVEFAYMGLFPDFIGQGYGGHMLTEAVCVTWVDTTSRVWLCTDNFDHPHALANYKARGFKVFKREVTVEKIPKPAPYWP